MDFRVPIMTMLQPPQRCPGDRPLAVAGSESSGSSGKSTVYDVVNRFRVLWDGIAAVTGGNRTRS